MQAPPGSSYLCPSILLSSLTCALWGARKKDINCSPMAGIIFTLIHPNSLVFHFSLSYIPFSIRANENDFFLP